MLASAITAYFHYLSIGIVFASLAMEFFTLKEKLTVKDAWRIVWADSAYGAAAVVLLITGILRVLYFAKDTAYYMHQPLFWAKIALYVIVGTVSLYPTISFILWVKSLLEDKAPEFSLNKYKILRGIIAFELISFSIIPLLASLMARGIGSDWFSS